MQVARAKLGVIPWCVSWIRHSKRQPLNEILTNLIARDRECGSDWRKIIREKKRVRQYDQGLKCGPGPGPGFQVQVQAHFWLKPLSPASTMRYMVVAFQKFIYSSQVILSIRSYLWRYFEFLIKIIIKKKKPPNLINDIGVDLFIARESSSKGGRNRVEQLVRVDDSTGRAGRGRGRHHSTGEGN